MYKKILTSCTSCGAIHASGQCPIKKKRNRKSTFESRFRSSRKWRNIRQAIIERDNYACKLCLINNKLNANALHVHHIQPLADHPELATTPSNLITLCKDCHTKIHEGKIKDTILTQLMKKSLAEILDSPPL